MIMISSYININIACIVQSNPTDEEMFSFAGHSDSIFNMGISFLTHRECLITVLSNSV